MFCAVRCRVACSAAGTIIYSISRMTSRTSRLATAAAISSRSNAARPTRHDSSVTTTNNGMASTSINNNGGVIPATGAVSSLLSSQHGHHSIRLTDLVTIIRVRPLSTG